MKKLSLVLVIALLISCIAACGSTQATSSVKDNATSDTEISAAEETPAVEVETEAEEVAEEEISAEVAESEMESAEEEVKPEGDVLTYELPLFDDTFTVSVWTESNIALAFETEEGTVDSWATAPGNNWTAELLNIYIEWTEVSMYTLSEQFNLMIASGDYCDVIAGVDKQYSGGIEKAYADGVIQNLTDAYPEYAPNLYNLIESDSAKKKVAYTDDGEILAIYSIEETPIPSAGCIIRQDWLDQLGMDTPVTYDDFHDVLVAFKSEFGATSPVLLTTTFQEDAGIASGYGIPGYLLDNGDSQFYVKDGTVYSSLTQDSYKDFLIEMHRWYEDGAINSQFYTQNGGGEAENKIYSGDVGMWYSQLMFLDNYNAAGIDDTFSAVGIQAPVLNEGDINHFMDENVGISAIGCISSSCEDVESVMKIYDFFATEQGFELANYGIEGKTYELDEDGNKVFYDKVYFEPYGFNLGSVIYMINHFATRTDFWIEVENSYSDTAKAAVETYLAHGDSEYTVPSAVSFTSEESDTYSLILSDIVTYANEWVLKFVIGEEDIESNWDTFQSELQNLRIDELLELYQTAYDRYLAK